MREGRIAVSDDTQILLAAFSPIIILMSILVLYCFLGDDYTRINLNKRCYIEEHRNNHMFDKDTVTVREYCLEGK